MPPLCATKSYSTMFEVFKNKTPISNSSLKSILNDLISPRVNKLGLQWDGNYMWFSNSENSIRRVLKYSLLKGEQGTFSWGVCFDFVPTISGTKLNYHRTERSVTLQLFEWTDEYANSFFGGQLADGVTSHWGIQTAKKSIHNLFKRYEKKIFDWFENNNNLDSLIQISDHQTKSGGIYKLNSPSPEYVLAFLLAKTSRIKEAISTFENIEHTIDPVIKNKIIMLLQKSSA